MNDILRHLYARKSVRVFEDREIPATIQNEILTAAAMAPTAGNQQLYTILRITDPELKHKLSISCDNQPFMRDAKLMLVFCADCLKWYNAYASVGAQPRKPGPGDLLLAVDDALIAAQNAVVAADSYGIGSCYIGDIMENCAVQRELLHLPDYVFPAALLVFGYPTEQQQNRKKPPRCDLSHIVHENTYRVMDAPELRQMLLKNTTEENYVAWLTAFCNRKYNSAFSREMSRSVAEYLTAYEQ